MARKKTGQTERTHAWLERVTGYGAQYSRLFLRARGVDWRSASKSEIREATAKHIATIDSETEARHAVVVIDGRSLSIAALAEALGVSTGALKSRRARSGSWLGVLAAYVASSRRQGHAYVRPAHPGRRRTSITVGGETREFTEWAALLGLTRQGLWRAARRGSRSISEEIAARVKTRRSDAAHAPVLSVASDQPPLIVSGDRAASACVASGSGANDSREVAA